MRGRRRAKKRSSQPLEYSLLLTATLCLLAFGVVMVFSASSTTSLLGESGDGAFYLKRTLMFGIAGLVVMRLLASHGVRVVRELTPALLVASLVLLVAVMVPGVGAAPVNGAQRWIGAGPIQVQPSELAKVALVLYGAYVLAARPQMVRSVRTLVPYLAVVALACGLVALEPDLGTAIIAALSAAALLVVAGVRMRHLAFLAGGLAIVVLLAIAIEPYRMARLTGFLDPAADPTGAGFQAIQARIALGSGGILGVGLGESLQKAFYLPEAHTDMIAAVIGEELGLAGILSLVGLYGMFGYAGLRTAQRAGDRYAKLLVAGLTSLVILQAAVNLFAVLGLAPLTGVPLPFVSYGNSSLLVMLAAVGLMLNVASGRAPAMVARSRSSEARDQARGSRSEARARAGARADGRLRVVNGGRPQGRPSATRGTRSVGSDRHSRGGDRGARGARARRRGRATR